MTAHMQVLHSSIKSGRLNFVKLMQKNGADLNLVDKQGKTALMIASRLGFQDMVEFLLESGVTLRLADTSGWTAVHEAVFGGHLNIVKLLVDNGGDIEQATNGGQTPLHFAANGSYEIARYLISKGVNPLIRDSNGKTSFDWALSKPNNFDIIELMWENYGECLLFGSESPPIFNAVISGDSEAVEFLLERGADLYATSDYDDSTVIHAAAINDNIEMIRYLVDIGVEVDSRDGDGWTPLHIAASRGFLNLAIFLISSGAIIDAQTLQGSTPLKLAVLNARTALVEFLITNGADVEITDDKGNTVLDVAARKADLKMALLLAGYGIQTLDSRTRQPLRPRDSIATVIDKIMIKETRTLESVVKDINRNYNIIINRNDSIENLIDL